MKKIPYREITNTNKIPKKSFVLIFAKISNAFESFDANNCVIEIILAKNIPNISKVNRPVEEVIITNQNVNPAETANALNRGEDNSILNRIDECNKT